MADRTRPWLRAAAILAGLAACKSPAAEVAPRADRSAPAGEVRALSGSLQVDAARQGPDESLGPAPHALGSCTLRCESTVLGCKDDVAPPRCDAQLFGATRRCPHTFEFVTGGRCAP